MELSFAGFLDLQRTFAHQRATDDGHVRIGLVQLASDFTLENEWRQLLGERVELYSTRTPCSPTVTPEGLRNMAQGLTQSSALLVPGLPLDVLAFGCTSGSMLIGEQEVSRLINRAHPGVPVTRGYARLVWRSPPSEPSACSRTPRFRASRPRRFARPPSSCCSALGPMRCSCPAPTCAPWSCWMTWRGSWACR